MASTTQNPYLFVFDGEANGVEEPALNSFTGAVLRALSAADPDGTTYSEIKGGLPLLSEVSQNVSAVSAQTNGSSYTLSHDMEVYRTMVLDMADVLAGSDTMASNESIFNVLRCQTAECLAFSDLSRSVVTRMHKELRAVAGYIGCFSIDPGNPILRRAFYDGLMRLATISNGAVVQELSIEGDPDFELEGASQFKPNGSNWVQHSYGFGFPDLRLAKAPLSERGRVSVIRLNAKLKDTVEERVFRSLISSSWTDRTGQSYEFSAPEPGRDILEAILPEGKFTNYLFNLDHKDGHGKAKFFVKELGFEPDDWRFLAAQFYDGLLLSEPHDLEVKFWKDGYGAKFNNYIRVTSRTGNSGIICTGWMLEPGSLPKLSTAFPSGATGEVIVPPKPPILHPAMRDDDWWEKLFDLSKQHAEKAYASTVPTPMFLRGWGAIEEGECGSAGIHLLDARKGFARWLLKTGNGYRGYRGGAYVACPLPSRSADRSKAYARAMARVLALNGVTSTVETSLS